MAYIEAYIIYMKTRIKAQTDNVEFCFALFLYQHKTFEHKQGISGNAW